MSIILALSFITYIKTEERVTLSSFTKKSESVDIKEARSVIRNSFNQRQLPMHSLKRDGKFFPWGRGEEEDGGDEDYASALHVLVVFEVK